MTINLSCIICIFIFNLLIILATKSSNETSLEERDRQSKVFGVFNVVTFPNSACGASNGYNGTCFTSSECTAKGGTASGTCASSFGVCCVFSISCGSTSSQNNTYAIISSYSTSSDSDPCIYTFCKANSNVCKLRIDYDTMVLSDPVTISSTAVATDSTKIGDCNTDTLTVSSPGHSTAPTICGYNTVQHMWVPASDQCSMINIDIDTGTTSTTRKWQIKVSQYECGNLQAPVLDCLQYHTATTGTIASFNWDTSASSVATSQTHLSNQYYDICLRRTRSYCSICYSAVIASTTAASSFGLGTSASATARQSMVGTYCSGVTTIADAGVGRGDYLEITTLQPGTGTSTTVSGTASRICGLIFNGASATTCLSTGSIED